MTERVTARERETERERQGEGWSGCVGQAVFSVSGVIVMSDELSSNTAILNLGVPPDPS